MSQLQLAVTGMTPQIAEMIVGWIAGLRENPQRTGLGIQFPGMKDMFWPFLASLLRVLCASSHSSSGQQLDWGRSHGGVRSWLSLSTLGKGETPS